MPVPDWLKRGVLALLLLGTLAAHIWFTVRISGDTQDAAAKMPVSYDDFFSYAAGLLAALVGTPAAIAFGQKAPEIPNPPNRPLAANVSALGARATGQTPPTQPDVATQVLGALYMLVWLATGAYALITWFANRAEASVAHYSVATAFSGIALGAIIYALRGKPEA